MAFPPPGCREGCGGLHRSLHRHGEPGKGFPRRLHSFRMAKVSPDTVTAGVVSYYYSDKTVSGFSFTHIGGADGGELANLLTMATTGPLHTYWGQRGKSGDGYQSSFSKDRKQRPRVITRSPSMTIRFAPKHRRPSQRDAAIHVSRQPAIAHPDRSVSPQRWHFIHQSVKVTDDHSIEGTIDCPAKEAAGVLGRPATPSTTISSSAGLLRKSASGVQRCRRCGAMRRFGTGSKNVNDPAFIEACRKASFPGCREKEGPASGILQ